MAGDQRGGGLGFNVFLTLGPKNVKKVSFGAFLGSGIHSETVPSLEENPDNRRNNEARTTRMLLGFASRTLAWLDVVDNHRNDSKRVKSMEPYPNNSSRLFGGI